MAILRRHRKNRKVIDCAVFSERRPLLLLAREGKIIRMERETKHRLHRQWASNLTKTFISDAQTGSVKLTTSIGGIVEHLSYLRNLCKIFFVHVKQQSVTIAFLPQVIGLLSGRT